jgi:hypothetical protein
MESKTARVYTTVPGDVVRIGNYGEATNDSPAVVPEKVAKELEAGMKGDPVNPKVTGHVGRPAHSRFRIERGGDDADEAEGAAKITVKETMSEDEAPARRRRG